MRRLRLRLLRRAIRDSIERSPRGGPMVLAALIGLLAGLGAVGFAWLVDAVNWVIFDLVIDDWLSALPDRRILIGPIIGGLLVGPITMRYVREVRGPGVADVMLSVETAGGRVRPRIAIFKPIASALTIGSGGSAGKEGPIIHIGAALGSNVAQSLRLSEENVKLLLAAGAAAGIAAIFNAPIAGVFFALEVILRRFNVRNFTIVVASAVVANMVAIAFEGDNPGINLAQYQLESAVEIGLYALLGLAAGIVGVVFMRFLYLMEDVFESLPLGVYGRAVLGMGLVGALGLWHDEIFGVGFPIIESASIGEFAAGTLALLMVLKIVATSFTLGGGASGGVFAPSLFMGAMLGSLLGTGFNELFSGSIAQPGAYAVVGMAAVFAAAARAPITSLFIVFEMTRDYSLILPLMVGVAVATALAQIITRDTIYSIKLKRLGVDINAEPQHFGMDQITVAETMKTNVPLVPVNAPLAELARAMSRTTTNVLAVSDEQGKLSGLVSASDLTAALERTDQDLTAADIAVSSPLRVYPDDTLREVVALMADNDIRQLPVVARWDERRLLGMITQRDVIREFARRAAAQTTVPDRPPPVRRLIGAVQIEMTVTPESELVDRELKDVPLPREAVITTIHRDGVIVIPRGDVTLKAGDHLTILTEPSAEQAVRRLLASVVQTASPDVDPQSPQWSGDQG